MNIIDMHCDTIAELYYKKRDGEPYDLKTQKLDINLDKLKKGDWMLQNFACFVNLGKVDKPYEYCLKLIDVYDEEMAKYPDIIKTVRSYKDIESNISQGIMSGMLTLEEGEVCEGSVEKLRELYNRGARMMTITWNHENSLAYPNKKVYDEAGKQIGTVPDTEHGLKEKGFEIIEEMERIGMIIDVSHLNDAGIWDVINHTHKPFVASHSNARSIASHPRNLTDEMIKAMSERGCVAGLNYCPPFLRDFKKGEEELCYIDDCIRMVKYMIDKGGEDFVGMGSDYDGFEEKMEWGDSENTSILIDAFKKAGLSSGCIDKITHKNVLRVYKELLV